ncbi:hypothetical protein EV210_106109 [Anaerospora hongkongensis]|uniref:Amidoligase enzyme n=2 Tax=root TaxID=1 RepID=A0A4R1Q766_9FIRM|nr:hypothetical protein [Anaerospora hongkongensis]TCL37240.1 hypothetical protein EV210_106109 [Anaerospora hongkongensis]
MEKHDFQFHMQVTGRERKEVAALIAAHFGTQAVYQGTRGFGYLITEPNGSGREWLVDKAGAIVTEGVKLDNVTEVFAVLKVLEENGIEAEGRAAVTLSIDGHWGRSLQNLVNILSAKERLIAKTMGTGQPFMIPEIVKKINTVRLKTIEDFLEVSGSEVSPGLAITQDKITLRWFAATLSSEIIAAYIQFAFAVNAMAMMQRHATPNEKETANEKYTFRVWLLRLGFIGEEYSFARRLFLSRLEGNGSFRTEDQVHEAVKRRKAHLATPETVV